MSCTTRKSSRLRISRASSWLIQECAGLVAITHRPADPAGQDPLDDLVVGQAVLGGDPSRRGCRACRRPCRGASALREVVAAEQAGGVAEEPRAHGVALAGDRVGAGAGPPDVAGHQRQVDDRLRQAHRLVALVDAHGPPERDALAARGSRSANATISSGCRPVASLTRSTANGATMRANSSKPLVCAAMKSRVDPAALDQQIRQAVEQRQVRLGLHGVGAAWRPSRSRSCADRRR